MNRLLQLLSGICLLCFATPATVLAQSSICIDSDPFCTGTNYVFPASVGAGSAENGPDYGCLVTQPNPVWYHMQIDDPGDLILEMYSTPEEDIDFICWGPFDDPVEPCVDDLNSDKIVDCSYSPYSTETCTVPDSETGEYYIVMITNYSDEPCNINFFQTGGEATTDCSIVPPQSGSNSPVCEGETLQLTAADVEGASYYWSGPQGFSSTEQNPQIQNATPDHSGTYEVIIELGGIESDPSETEVVVSENPVVHAGEDQTIPFGTNTTLYGTVDGNEDDYVFSWQPEALLDNPTILEPQTVNLEATTTFALMATHADYGCSGSDQMTVIVEGDPLFVQIIAEDEVCQGDQITLQSQVEGGSGTYEYYWISDPPGFESTSPAPEVSPTQNTTYILEVDDGYNTSSTQKLIVVHELPAAYAGQDQSIPYGTSTQLYGSVEGDENDYDVNWQPQDLLQSTGEWEPYTVQLENTQEFILTLEDTENSCVGSDNVIVTVTGGPLSVTISASDEYVCYGDQVQLTAYGSGGSGDYTYAWSSDPDGFNSNLPNPVVMPQEETTYIVVLDDGYNTAEHSITMDVKANPQLEVMNDTSVVYGSVVELLASASEGAPPYAYFWSPEEFLQQSGVPDPSTTELFSNTTFTVFAEDGMGCTSEAEDIFVNIETNTLSVSVSPGSPEVCAGDSMWLSGNYTGNIGQVDSYWTDADGNVLETQESMLAVPDSTTDYYYVAHDQYFSDSVLCRLVVFPNPVVAITAEGYTINEGSMSICVYDTVELVASEEMYAFSWSNGATTPQITIGTSGIAMDMQRYTVTATSQQGCMAADSLLAVFSYNACVGIPELYGENLNIVPNPARHKVKIAVPNEIEKGVLIFSDIEGAAVQRQEFSGRKQIIDISAMSKGVYVVSLITNSSTFHQILVIR